MIIIIAGKIKSGKDTVAKLISKEMDEINKKTVIIQFSSYIKMYAKNILNWNGLEETKPRKFLQDLGQDIRNNISNKFFINRIIDDIKVYSDYMDMIIISDARLPEEIDCIKEKYPNAISIKVERKDFNQNITLTEKNHITEHALDNYNYFDYIIENDGSLNDLNTKVIKILNNIKEKE